jgi:uncharacterized protein (DUF1697 family)
MCEARYVVHMAEYLTLLRGINVGGNALVKMGDLKAALTDAGFTDVRTYIQSGNVFVTTPERSRVKVAGAVATVIEKAFGHKVGVVAFTKADWKQVVGAAPKWWGTGDGWKHDLYVLIPPFEMRKVVTSIGDPTVDIEKIEAGKGVVYVSLVIAKHGRTAVSKIVGKPIYKQLTIRNYNTSTKLLGLFS